MAATLAGVMLCSTAYPAFAAENSSEKEEVIYINLDAQGFVKDVYAVNIFGKGDIVDYGDYASVEMLNINADIDQNGDEISFSTDAERVYYKGKMNQTEIPWNISIQYYLDGALCSAQDAAGKSGSLEIKFAVTENQAYEGDFFDSYALQASFTLDTEKCTNITAEGATIANVGSDKQITYTILPGEGIETSITADVKDFEMAAAAINGIPLSLNVEVDDEELMDQVTELLDAIAELDDGVGELQDGAKELKDGAESELQDGISELQDGAGKLYDGAGTLKTGGSSLKDGTKDLQEGIVSLNSGVNALHTGIAQIQAGLNELDGKSSELTEGSAEVKAALKQIQSALTGVSVSVEELEKLTAASAEVLTGITSLSDGIHQLYAAVSVEGYKAAMKGADGQGVDELKTANTQAISQLEPLLTQIDGIIGTLQGYASTPVIGQVASQMIDILNNLKTPLSNMTALLQKNNECIAGTEAYLTAVNENIKPLAEGAATLKEKYTEFDGVIQTLVGTLQTMLGQVSELSSGIDTLVAEYEKLDTGILEYTSGVAQIAAGYSEVSSGSASLVAGSRELVSGSSSLYDGTAELLSGIVEIYNATGTLKDGTGALDDGVAELLLGISELYDGTGTLKDGTSQFREETQGMDTEISDKIDEMLNSITGGDSEIVSFVSEKNTNVESVQFVIQTEAIEIPEAVEEESAEKEPMTFGEKLLHLFGLD